MRILLIVVALTLVGLIITAVALNDQSIALDGIVDRDKPKPNFPYSTQAHQPSTKTVVTQYSELNVNNDFAFSSNPKSVAVQSLAETMKTGDPRTPPLAPKNNPRTKPSTEELASRDLYREFEARQEQAIYASFAAVAKHKITELEQQIELGKQFGINQEQLYEATQKLDSLRKQREIILRDHLEVDTESPTKQ
ncbi:hypothetical protein ACJJIG_15620 [Microbulbifer sp. SSSA007]|uniref:hypothetical protein n=1 Tax=Microbulbifer sp. SSSA007 TaxID=3243379 RepID=UPI004039E156